MINDLIQMMWRIVSWKKKKKQQAIISKTSKHLSLFIFSLGRILKKIATKEQNQFLRWVTVGQKIKKKVQAKKLVKSNKAKKFFFREIAFWQFQSFSQFKNWFLAIFEMAKNGIWSKKFFVKLFYLISRVFMAWTFSNFLAYCASVQAY